MCEVVSQHLFQAIASSTREQTIASLCSVGKAVSSRDASVISDINLRDSKMETLTFDWFGR